MDLRTLVLFVIFSTQLSHAENPGLRIRFSQKGLDYVVDEAASVLRGKVDGKRINDFEDLDNFGWIELTGMTIQSFGVANSTLSANQEQGITWKVNGASIRVHGDVYHSLVLDFYREITRGNFDISTDDITYSYTVAMAMADGRPTISPGSCQANVGRLNVTTEVTLLYKEFGLSMYFFKESLKEWLKKILTDLICDEAKKVINVDAAELLASLDMTVPIGGDAILNYSLIAQPTFTSSYIESYHKAEVTWKGDPVPSSVKAPPMPDTTSNHMISFWLSDYLMNSLGDVTYRHDTLEKNLTGSDLGEKEKWLLNTTCPTGYCIGKAIPPLAEKFPYTSVALEMSASSRPQLVIKENILEGQFAGIVKCNVLLPGGSSKYAMTTELTLNVTLNVTLTGTDLTAAITNHKLGLNVIDMIEELGPIPSSLNTRMHWFFDIIAYGYITQNLNELGAKGFPLPKIKNVKYVNPSLTIEKGLLGIMTDVKYDPSY